MEVTFTVTVTDDDGNVESQDINVTVNAVNDDATFGGDTTGTGDEDTTITGTLTASDMLMVYQIQTSQSVPMEQMELHL